MSAPDTAPDAPPELKRVVGWALAAPDPQVALVAAENWAFAQVLVCPAHLRRDWADLRASIYGAWLGRLAAKYPAQFPAEP